MSNWTYVNGIVKVEPLGRTQAEKEYILKTVLEHLPVVSGSEADMSVFISLPEGHNSSQTCDEFGQRTNNLRDHYGNRNRRRGFMYMQERYILTLNGALRDKTFDETYREFQKWLTRLAKRVAVTYVLVQINDYYKSIIISDDGNVYSKLLEYPSWSRYCKRNYVLMEKLTKFHPEWSEDRPGEPTWCEYLMWQRMGKYYFPSILGYKYFNDEKNDEKVKQWLSDD